MTAVVDLANEQLTAVPFTVQGEASEKPVSKLILRLLVVIGVWVNILMAS